MGRVQSSPESVKGRAKHFSLIGAKSSKRWSNGDTVILTDRGNAVFNVFDKGAYVDDGICVIVTDDGKHALVLPVADVVKVSYMGIDYDDSVSVNNVINYAESNKINISIDKNVSVLATSLSILVYGGYVTLGSGALYVPSPDKIYSSTGGARNSINYETGSSVSVKGKSYSMGGFRMHGQYFNSVAPVFNAPSFLNSIDIATSLPFGMTETVGGWYAVFAAASDGDAVVSFYVVPFLRVKSVVGSVVTLARTVENIAETVPEVYPVSVDAMVGAELLVINDSAKRPNAFSGRVTDVIANTSTTITMGDIGGVSPNDWLLPAPLEKEHYRYCGAFLYEDAGGGAEEVRNIADTGSIIKAKMVNHVLAPVGSQVGKLQLNFSTLISPLASAVIVKETGSFSTTASGSFASQYDNDSSSHAVATTYYQKISASSETYVKDGIVIPFSFSPDTFHTNYGNMAPYRSGGTLEIQGWIES